MKSLHRQKGLSLIGVGLLAFLVIFFGLLIIKMSGTYYDHYTLDQMIKTSLEGQTAARFSPTEFEDRLRKNMDINQIQMDLDDALTINRRTDPMQIVIEYEQRVHLFANVDVVMMFHEEYEL